MLAADAAGADTLGAPAKAGATGYATGTACVAPTTTAAPGTHSHNGEHVLTLIRDTQPSHHHCKCDPQHH